MPRMGPQRVGLGEPVRVRVARHVEPVPRPALAVGWRRQQPVHHLFVGIRCGVREERIDLLRLRRSPVRSSVTRRRSVRRSASGAKSSPLACSFASTNASTGFSPLRFPGTVGCRDRLERPERAILIGDPKLGGCSASSRSVFAPCAIHCSSVAISGAVSFLPFSASHPRAPSATSRFRRLPGTITCGALVEFL